jgi:hypothetical protein
MSSRERLFLRRWVSENAGALRGASADPEREVETLLSRLILDAERAGLLTADLLAAADGDLKAYLHRARDRA